VFKFRATAEGVGVWVTGMKLKPEEVDDHLLILEQDAMSNCVWIGKTRLERRVVEDGAGYLLVDWYAYD